MTDLKRISDWFRDAAEAEAGTPITVGATMAGPAARAAAPRGTEGLALAKLVTLRRRQCRLSVEDLARMAQIDLEDVVNIERGEGSRSGPRAVRQVAIVLDLPERRLLELAGLLPATDRHLREAAVRFAARSEPVEDLRPGELAALEEYVKVLAGS